LSQAIGLPQFDIVSILGDYQSQCLHDAMPTYNPVSIEEDPMKATLNSPRGPREVEFVGTSSGRVKYALALVGGVAVLLAVVMVASPYTSSEPGDATILYTNPQMCPFKPAANDDGCQGPDQPEGNGGCNNQCYAMGCKYFESKYGACTDCNPANNCGPDPYGRAWGANLMCYFQPKVNDNCKGQGQDLDNGGCNEQCYALGCKFYFGKGWSSCTACDPAHVCGASSKKTCPFIPKEQGTCQGPNQPDNSGGCNDQCYSKGCKYYIGSLKSCTDCDEEKNCGQPASTSPPAPEPEPPKPCEGTKTWSGSWDSNGFVGPMTLDLKTNDGQLTGSGKDEIGSFTIQGSVSNAGMKFTKDYTGSYSVEYDGTWDPTGASYKGDYKIAASKTITGSSGTFTMTPPQC